MRHSKTTYIDNFRSNPTCYLINSSKKTNLEKWVNRKQLQFYLVWHKEFYLSITENVLQQTLKFAKQHTNIEKNDLHAICKPLSQAVTIFW